MKLDIFKPLKYRVPLPLYCWILYDCGYLLEKMHGLTVNDIELVI